MQWNYHDSPNNKCPFCGAHKDCRTSPSGLVFCKNTSEWNAPAGYRYIKLDKTTGVLNIFAPVSPNGYTPSHSEINPQHQPAHTNTAKKKKKPQVSKFERIKKDKQPLRPDEAAEICSRIQTTPEVMDDLEVGSWRGDDNWHAFIFPEKNANFEVIGYSIRYADNSKRSHGNRGLTISKSMQKSLFDPTDKRPIIIVEGQSDTSACLRMGLRVIGRFSNTGGVSQLIELLKEVAEDIPIIVVGENDLKSDGKWPGRTGAESTAEGLASGLGRKVQIAFPPPAVKDIREWLKVEFLMRSPSMDDPNSKIEQHAIMQDMGRSVLAMLMGTEEELSESDKAIEAKPNKYWYLANPILPKTVVNPLVDPAEVAASQIISQCPCERGIHVAHRWTPKDRVFHVPCKKLSCDFCSHKRKTEIMDNAQQRFADLNPDSTVYVFWVDEAHWEAAYVSLKGAPYHRINVNGDGLYLVFTTAMPTRGVDPDTVTEMSPAMANDRMAGAIAQLPKLDTKLWTSSRDWGIEREKKVSQWRRIGAVASSLQTVCAILDERNISYKFVEAPENELWRWHGIQFKHDGIEDLDQVRGEIMMGCVLPDGMFSDHVADADADNDWLTFDQHDDGGGGVGTAPTGKMSFFD